MATKEEEEYAKLFSSEVLMTLSQVQNMHLANRRKSSTTSTANRRSYKTEPPPNEAERSGKSLENNGIDPKSPACAVKQRSLSDTARPKLSLGSIVRPLLLKRRTQQKTTTSVGCDKRIKQPEDCSVEKETKQKPRNPINLSEESIDLKKVRASPAYRRPILFSRAETPKAVLHKQKSRDGVSRSAKNEFYPCIKPVNTHEYLPCLTIVKLQPSHGKQNH
ncbi:predicted protein [Nematostella vectensis]|uniref:Uncharacterized protein n=1 Tax=Nematostella vectensis TaxID=45351 RepID=A7SI26_NEMVE|nr:predicted protein [Nematostella vectensis]|eukprot:XP_001628714.1 predicted protein [Nematostella vectensis]